jgi:hypothetical protein
MVGRKWLALAMLFAAAPAWGQSEEEVAAAAGKQIDAFTACIKMKAGELAKSSTLPADLVAEKAVNSCTNERHSLWEQFQKPPLSWDPERAAREITDAVAHIKPQIVQTIGDARF